MAATDRRRFTIADAMILVAATAVGMLMVRESLPGFYRRQDVLRSVIPGLTPGAVPLAWASGPLSCLVASWMAGLVAIRLRSPRPRLRRVVRQPGFAACVATVAALVPGAARCLMMGIFRAPYMIRYGFEASWSTAREWVPPAVLGGWLALAIAGRWRPEPGWIDRLGRLLGAYWVAILALMFLDFWAALLLRSLGL